MTSRESCLLCQIIGNKIPSYKVYEDDLTLAVLDVNGANPGHCFVMPKEHYPIIEQVPDDVLRESFHCRKQNIKRYFRNFKSPGNQYICQEWCSCRPDCCAFYG